MPDQTNKVESKCPKNVSYEESRKKLITSVTEGRKMGEYRRLPCRSCIVHRISEFDLAGSGARENQTKSDLKRGCAVYGRETETLMRKRQEKEETTKQVTKERANSR